MGYTTEFHGSLTPNTPFSEDIINYINTFSSTRRMKRNVEKIKTLFPNWEEYSFKGDLGIEGEYFACNRDDNHGQTNDGSVVEYNSPPITQPGLWCEWEINGYGEVEWNGGEKFYYYVEWLNYLIRNFFSPEGYILNGEIEYRGEDFDDYGTITVTDNVVTVACGF